MLVSDRLRMSMPSSGFSPGGCFCVKTSSVFSKDFVLYLYNFMQDALKGTCSSLTATFHHHF